MGVARSNDPIPQIRIDLFVFGGFGAVGEDIVGGNARLELKNDPWNRDIGRRPVEHAKVSLKR